MNKNASQTSITSRKSDYSSIKEEPSLPPKVPTPEPPNQYTPREDNLTVFEKEDGVLVYVTKPSPDFFLVGVKDNLKFGERMATRDEVEDAIG